MRPAVLLVWTASPVVAGVAGAVAPPLIATTRSVWPRIAGPELTRAGHGLNALLGDIGSIAGPALTGAFAAAASPGLALGVFAGGTLLGALIVARLGFESQTGSVSKEGQSRFRFGWTPGLRTLLIVDLSFGVAAGAIDVAGPALAGADPALAALPLVAFAVGSVAGSLWAGQSASAADRRFVAGSCTLAAVLAGCAFVSSVGALAAVSCVAGVAYGVFNVGVFELLDVVVPAHRAVEALTWLTTAGSLGMAAGAAAAGQLAHDSPRAALLLVAVGTAPGAIFALARRRTLTERERARS